MSTYPPPGRLKRKWLKLRRDPVRFFADARNPVMRKMGLWGLAGREEQAAEILGRIRGGTEGLGKWIAPAPRPRAPKEEEWRRLAARPVGAPAIDVIVPVHGARDDTLACLHAVLSARQATPHELIVIDDASPDSRLSAELAGLAGKGLFTLIRNEDNLGFVHSANAGMALHGDRDVVLLNSDTMVYGDWLDRLHRHALAAPDVATVTPLSNNATISSYPQGNRNNNTLLEADHEVLDALAARVNKGQAIEAPTGVGFCLYIRRDCLKAVGLFDAARYGRGYGEENDLCQKAIGHGMRNLIATDIFVRHTGEASFAETARRAQARALDRIAGRFPNYHGDIQRYIARDPLAPARRALDRARLTRAAGPGPVLFVTHGRGGGVERHIRDTIETLAESGTGAILLRGRQGHPGELTLNVIDELYLPNLNPPPWGGAPDGPDGLDELAGILRAAGISRIQIHSLADYPPDAVARLPALAAALGVPYEFMLHDYLPVCPRINLIDHSGLYCGETGPAACAQCLARGDLPPGARDIEGWRAAYGRLLAGAEAVAAPSDDAARRLRRYFPALTVETRPHRDIAAPPKGHAPPPPWRAGEPLRVAVIGAIGPHKGSAILLACARDALARKLPLEFIVFGTADNVEALAALPNVTVTGRYEEVEILDLIAAGRCHMAFLPAVWPETYSYTLTIARAAGLPVAVFDLGAPAARVAQGKTGWLLPWAFAEHPEKLVDALLELGCGEKARNSRLRPDDGNRVRAAFGAAPAVGPNTAAFLRLPRGTQNYCICFTPRSGSSWLTDLLTGTKRLGCPGEWFNPDHLPRILETYGCNDVETYMDILRRKTRTPNGVFGMEISFFQLKQLEDMARLDALIGPDARYVYLTRKDFVAQAVSLYRAVETGYFHSVQAMNDATARKLDRLPYDAGQIERWAAHILQQEFGFERMFAERGIAPLRLTYEAMAQSPEDSLRAITRHLDIEGAAAPPESNHSRISGETSEEWATRFRADRAGFVETWTVKRGRKAAA